jgi:hypothetical protein
MMCSGGWGWVAMAASRRLIWGTVSGIIPGSGGDCWPGRAGGGAGAGVSVRSRSRAAVTAQIARAGNDECDPASGRGWAVLQDDGSLRGRIFFHLGDDPEFTAVREAEPTRQGCRFGHRA